MESAQTGQVGKALPRGTCLMIVIDLGPHWPLCFSTGTLVCVKDGSMQITRDL
jgi:hypothetical protein